MHGYVAACIIPENFSDDCPEEIIQEHHQYVAITIKEPFKAPFTLIPNAYKTLIRYIEVNSLNHKQNKEVLSCFEKEYNKDGVSYMDVYIAVE